MSRIVNLRRPIHLVKRIHIIPQEVLLETRPQLHPRILHRTSIRLPIIQDLVFEGDRLVRIVLEEHFAEADALVVRHEVVGRCVDMVARLGAEGVGEPGADDVDFVGVAVDVGGRVGDVRSWRDEDGFDAAFLVGVELRVDVRI